MKLYPELDPHESGRLDVGDGHSLYWEVCGRPDGRPALVLHGGPGSGCTPWQRRLFDPERWRVVLVDQRNCGRSTPHASRPDVDLSRNTTHDLIGDLDRLRAHLEVERWLVLGGSWGSTLALAYAERHVERVRALVLFGVTCGRHAEFDHVFRGGLAAEFPEAWRALREAIPARHRRDGDVLAACQRWLFDPDPDECARAARAWCLWESASPVWPPPATPTLAARFANPAYALCFARIVTHYALHYAWLEDGQIERDLGRLAGIPVELVQGERDAQTLDAAERIAAALPLARLVRVADAGHAADHPDITSAIVAATDRLASEPA